MTRIYLTHCSAEKDPTVKELGKTVRPEDLYTGSGIQRFMARCKETGVIWAVLSDLYGVYGSDELHGWYEKPPDTVTQQEEDKIIQDFDLTLSEYDEIWFYIRPKSFHPFYTRVLERTMLSDKVRAFEDLELIEQS